MKKIICTAMLILMSVLVLSACNTIEGVGKDIKKGGAAIEKSAQ